MSQFQPPADPGYAASPTPRPARRTWLWVLLIVIAFLGLSCIGCMGVLVWLGVTAPETFVVPGHSVRNEFVIIMNDTGALEPEENIVFFYSDGITDIRDGYYFISDRKVAVYNQNHQTPLMTVTFDEIVDVQLHRDTSFLIDSQIDIETINGEYITFPVSSENDGDVRFFDAITKRMPAE